MKQTINNSPAASGLGDTLYVTTTKINENFTEVYDFIEALQTELSGYDLPTVIENLNGLFTVVGEMQTSLTSINNNILSLNNSITAQNITITELQTLINNL